MEKKKRSWKKKESNFEKKRGKVGKKIKKRKKKKTLWITVVIHSNLGVREQWFPRTI